MLKWLNWNPKGKRKEITAMQTQKTICLIGNPNCGKTTLFNALTGSRQKVGNWAGVTVERKDGWMKVGGDDIRVVDLPGIYSITPSEKAAVDETIARNYILTHNVQAAINIVDGSNLERNLYLTSQLLEMKVPVILVVNMLDIARQQNLEVDLGALSQRLGCPVIGIIASKENGIDELKRTIGEFVNAPSLPSAKIQYNGDIVAAQGQISALLGQHVQRADWFALQFLEQAPKIHEQFTNVDFSGIDLIVDKTNQAYAGTLDIVIAKTRYSWVKDVADACVRQLGEISDTLSERIDRVMLHRWLGFPLFLFIMYLMFLFTQNVGAAFIDFFDIFVGGLFVDGLGQWMTQMNMPTWLVVFVANGIGGGLQTVSTFIPVIFFLFLFLSILEESGYMARAAFLMDRLMRSLGLPGKAFVPLLTGFGCTVPAIMGTRTLERSNDRIVAVMMAPFMSCGARLPVYVLFATAFFPSNGQNLVFGLYLMGIVAAIVTAFLLKRSAVPGTAGAFVMEMPPYHVPTLKNLWMRTWTRLRSFIYRAGRVIIIIVACLSFLNSLGQDGSFGNEDSNNSVLSGIGQTITPIFAPMGIQQENWPASVGIFTGLFAKEAVVGTLNSLYSTINANETAQDEGAQEPEEESAFSVTETFKEAWGTIGENLAGLTDALTDPMGIAVDDLSDTEAVVEDQGVSTGTIASLQQLFGSTSAAFAYLILILFYMPCCAAVAALWREVGPRWTIFACAWTTVLGYTCATIFYRAVNFAQAPMYACIAIALSLAALVGMYQWMKRMALKDYKQAKRIIPIIQVR